MYRQTIKILLAGLEPAHNKAKDFKSFVSTNFTIEAVDALGIEPKAYGLKVHHSTTELYILL